MSNDVPKGYGIQDRQAGSCTSRGPHDRILSSICPAATRSTEGKFRLLEASYIVHTWPALPVSVWHRTAHQKCLCKQAFKAGGWES